MRIAVLGCGNMGRAIISSLLSCHDDLSIIAYDTSDVSLQKLPDQVLVVSPDEWELADNRPDAIVIAVKPQDMEQTLLVFSDMEDQTDNPLFISVAAGLNLATLETFLPAHARICRVMPNTPALIGEGMSAYCFNDKCNESDTATADFVLSSCGKAVCVPEKLMNAVTGLSGSGPAYVYLFIEALTEGGVTAGLPYAMAKEMAIQTIIGSAKMAAHSTEDVGTLKARVMSPNGTTVQGLLALEEHGFKYAVIKAVQSASKRAEEIGKQG